MTEKTPMTGVIPYLALGGRSAEASDFYCQAFGAEDGGRMPYPDGAPGLMHAQVLINGGMLMKTDQQGDGSTPSTNFGHLQLVVSDGRMWWDRAVGADCSVLVPYERQPWEDDWGLLQDPFGLKWAIMQIDENAHGSAEPDSAEAAA